MSYFIPALFITAWTIITAGIFRHRFEEAVPVSVMSMTVVVYILTYIFDFNIAVGIMACIILLGIICLILKIQKGRWENWKQDLFTPGLAILLLLMAFLLWINRNRGVMLWDETSHWAMMVKETLRTGDFYCTNASTLLAHKDYPPMICMFESLYCRLSGGYQEGYVYTALQLLELSFFFPFLSITRSDRTKPVGTLRRYTGLGVVLIMMIFGVVFCGIPANFFYASLYEDVVLALEFCYGSLIIYRLTQETVLLSTKEDSMKKSARTTRVYLVTNLTLVFAFLLMTKQMGIIFFALLILYYVASQLCNKIRMRELAILVTAPVLLYITWKIRIQQYGLANQAQFQISDLRITDLLGIIFGKSGEQWQIQAAHNYLQALWNVELHHYGIPCSYLLLVVAFLILFAVVSLLLYKLHIQARLLLPTGILGLGAIGYGAIMLMMYTFSFGPEEGPVLASFDRYMNTYIFIMWMSFLLLMTYIFVMHFSDRGIFVLGVLMALGLLFYIVVQKQWDRITAPATYQSMNDVYQENAAYLETNTPDDARILFIDTSLDEYHFRYQCYALRYLTTPRIYQPQDWRSRMERASIAEMKQELTQWDYVYFIHVDESWTDSYGSLFNQDIHNGLLYQLP